MSFMNHKTGGKMIMAAASLSTRDREDLYVSLVRGFKPGEDYLKRYRFKPCAALLNFIYFRVSTFDYHETDLVN